jgi:AraC-like DNA-binding protein
MDYLARSIPDLTFRFFKETELLDLGMLGYAVLSCTNVGNGLRLLARYLELTSDRYTERNEIRDHFYTVRPQPVWQHLGEEKSIAEDCLSGNWHAVRVMLGPEADLHGARVYFSYPAPEYEASYRAFFHPCQIIFQAEHSELHIPEAWLERPVTTGNSVMSDVTSSICERMLGPQARSNIDTPRAVRRLLLSRPGQHMLRLEEAAERLNMSTAQLRKRLYRAGTNYKSIVLEVRMALASHYLESTHLSIQEIAYLLDYTQPGPFSRAFKKYYGQSPRSVRIETSGQA